MRLMVAVERNRKGLHVGLKLVWRGRAVVWLWVDGIVETL